MGNRVSEMEEDEVIMVPWTPRLKRLIFQAIIGLDILGDTEAYQERIADVVTAEFPFRVVSIITFWKEDNTPEIRLSAPAGETNLFHTIFSLKITSGDPPYVGGYLHVDIYLQAIE
jgi:hypothetical protein